jgi:hypothetical protein
MTAYQDLRGDQHDDGGCPADGIGSVRFGDQAGATATASAGTVTAIRIGGLSQLRPGPGDLPGRVGQRLIPLSHGGSADSFSGGLAVAEPR